MCMYSIVLLAKRGCYSLTAVGGVVLLLKACLYEHRLSSRCIGLLVMSSHRANTKILCAIGVVTNWTIKILFVVFVLL